MTIDFKEIAQRIKKIPFLEKELRKKANKDHVQHVELVMSAWCGKGGYRIKRQNQKIHALTDLVNCLMDIIKTHIPDAKIPPHVKKLHDEDKNE